MYIICTCILGVSLIHGDRSADKHLVCYCMVDIVPTSLNPNLLSISIVSKCSLLLSVISYIYCRFLNHASCKDMLIKNCSGECYANEVRCVQVCCTYVAYCSIAQSSRTLCSFISNNCNSSRHPSMMAGDIY